MHIHHSLPWRFKPSLAGRGLAQPCFTFSRRINLDKPVECLTKQQANAYLHSIGMEIGEWNQITDLRERQVKQSSWINYRPPKDALFNFSYHAAGWLPRGGWKIFQIDNSTGWMEPTQESLFGSLLFGANNIADFNQRDNKTFLFEFGKNKTADENTELLISNLIYVFLLFESRGFVVSSHGDAGQRLGVQDGVVYFSAMDPDLRAASTLIERFERAPLALPAWVMEIYGERQQALMGGGS